MLKPNQHQPDSLNVSTVVIPTLRPVAQPLAMSTTTAMALDTLLPCAGSPALMDVQMTATGPREIPEADSTDPAAASTEAGWQTEVGSLTTALDTVPTETSAPAIAPPLTMTKEARENLCTMDEEALPHTGIK